MSNEKRESTLDIDLGTTNSARVRGVNLDMELSRNSTHLIFLATLNIAFAMYNVMTMQDWANRLLPVFNFFIILFAFAAIENEIEKKQITQRDDSARVS